VLWRLVGGFRGFEQGDLLLSHRNLEQNSKLNLRKLTVPVASMPCSSDTTSQNLAPIWLPH
jgi:hypothetical protein